MLEKTIVLRLSADGNTYDVYEENIVGYLDKIRGCRTYDAARKFAEKLARDKNTTFFDYAKPAEALPDKLAGLSPEDKLLKTIFENEEK